MGDKLFSLIYPPRPNINGPYTRVNTSPFTIVITKASWGSKSVDGEHNKALYTNATISCVEVKKKIRALSLHFFFWPAGETPKALS